MKKSNVIKTILLGIMGFVLLPNPQANAKLGGIGLWECSISVFGSSYYGRSITEASARQKASESCSQSQDSMFCGARKARCNKTIGVGNRNSTDSFENTVLVNVTENLAQCRTYEAYCSGIGGSSGYGSSIAEAKNNMPVNCIPVSVRCVD